MTVQQGQLNPNSGKVEQRRVSGAMRGVDRLSEGTIKDGPFKRALDRLIK
jgi:hypothetical protein